VGHSGATPDLISTPLDETADCVGPLQRTDMNRRAREASDRRFVQVHDSDYVSVYDYVQVQVQVQVQVHVHVHGGRGPQDVEEREASGAWARP